MASTSGSLATTGQVALTGKLPDHATTLVAISGTFTTVTFVIEGSFDGSVFFPLVAISEGTGAIVTGTISPTNSTNAAWIVPSVGLVAVQARVTAIATGAAVFGLQSGSYPAPPMIAQATTGDTLSGVLSLAAGLTFSGANTVNVVSVPDNLADALNVKEGSTSYLKFVTTDNAEGLVAGKKMSLAIVATPVAAAGAGGGVAGAAQLGLANIVTISSDGATKGVKLKTGTAGDKVFVLNTSATAANLFAASGGTINGGSADAGCAVPASKGVLAICTAADTWTVFDLAAHSGAAA